MYIAKKPVSDFISLNAHFLTEDKSNDLKVSSYV